MPKVQILPNDKTKDTKPSLMCHIELGTGTRRVWVSASSEVIISFFDKKFFTELS